MTEIRPPAPPRCREISTMIEARIKHGFPPASHTVQIDKVSGQVVGGSSAFNGVLFHYLLAAAQNYREKKLTALVDK